ncbi:MAG: hypothetical protein II951_06290 [Bacteroidales bacterium]|nr:hypothetical protein [Bacteroidales bacterium]
MSSILNKFLAASAVTAQIAIFSSSLTFVACDDQSNFAFETDSIVFERNWSLPQPKENDPLGGRSRFSAKVDYPKAHQNDSILADSVRIWISYTLLPDGEAPLKNRSVLDKAANIFFGECEGNEWGEEMELNVHKIYEDKKYVTYESIKYIFTGGAHGSCTVGGATFDRSTGRRLTWADFKKDDELRSQITDGIRRLKGQPSDSAFKTMLLIDEREYKAADGSIMLPLPKVSPWLSKAGWVFTYQPYEILPWSQGTPACCIPVDDIALN